MKLTPTPTIVFDDGPEVRPAAALLKWLDAVGKEKPERLVRLPVTLELGVLGVKGARVGDLPVSVVDSALGVGLWDRARQACGQETSCTLWVVGFWRGGKLDARDTGGVVEGGAARRAGVEKARTG